MQIRPKLIENLDRIIAESVKQMENIDPIKIVQVEGLSSGASVGVDGCAQDGNLSGQVVTSALRYRTQQRIAMEQEVAEREISKARAVETQDIEKAKAIELSEQDRNIVVAEKSRPSPKPRHRLTRRWLWLFRRRSSQGGARS
jgi:uncharacterized membrane protein YqiK